MSQAPLTFSQTTGPEFVTFTQDALAALATVFKGSTQPAGILEGQVWIDDSNDPTEWLVKRYINAQDVTVASIDPSSRAVTLIAPEIRDYSLTANALGDQATAVAGDFTLGNVTTATLTGNVTVTVANWPASGRLGRMEIHLAQDATGSRAVSAWPVDKWVGGSAPTLGTASGDVDIVVIFTADNGTTRIGVHVGTAS